MDGLVALGSRLREAGYAFITPTPETHRRVLLRGNPARTLRDVFGWNKPFARWLVPEELLALLGPALLQEGDLYRSAVRYSTLGEMIFMHSAYPTVEHDAVFFGPDTYRFVSLLQARVAAAGHVADVGCGSGAGGLLLAGRAKTVQLLDINPRALGFAADNAKLNRVDARIAQSDVLSGAEGPLDLVIANPPYIADDAGRAYRDGGGSLGTALSARICEESLQRLRPGGRLILYTGTPVIEGEHVLWRQVQPFLRNLQYDYRELDPDVFGEELDQPAYSQTERLAVVALDVVKS
ncbi:MAG TPA: class I SAM-dependent methyltransferase [Myxococcales bacterium]|jgi:methylase of polypeptide subunit release factors|nr:class I SAM-dependent methyltransferase [Myxococcales bacterium]